MNGIASLPQGSNMPQGGPAPGQAAPGQMPGMPMPQAQGTPMGVMALIPPLKQLNIQQLQMELMSPGSKLPKFAVLSALDQKLKEQRAMQAVMGMQAQQQTAQDPGTVAQQVMQAAQQPVMARHGGAMHSYRQGGEVGYANGPSPEGVQSGGATSYPVKDQEDVESLSVNERFKRTLERLLGSRDSGERSRKRYPTMYGEPPAGKPALDTGDETARLLARSPAPMDLSDLEPTRQPLPKTPLPPDIVPQAAAPAAPKEQSPADTGLPKLLEEMDPYFKAERERLDAAGKPSADVIKAREAYDALMKEQATARTAAAERRAKGIEALQERAARAGDIDTSDLLLALGTGLLGAKTFSEGLGAAGQQLQGMRKSAAERTERAQERVERRQDLADQLAVKDAELARVEQAELVARATGDDKTAREAVAAKNELLKERVGILLKLEELGLKRREVAATEVSAGAADRRATAAEDTSQATREATSFSRAQGQLGINLSNMQRDMAEAEKDFAKQHSLILNLVKLGSKLTPDQEKQYQNAMAGLAATRRKVEDQYVPIINAISRQIYGQDYFKPSSSTEQPVYDFNKIGGR